MSISPNGQELAWKDGSFGQDRLNIYNIAARKPPRVIAVDPGYHIRWINWSDDDTLLYSLGQVQKWQGKEDSSRPREQVEVTRVFAIGTEDKLGRMMLAGDSDLERQTRLDVLRSRLAKPHTILVSLFMSRSFGGALWVSSVYAVDTRTGKGTPVAKGDLATVQWLVNADGQVVARSEWNRVARECEIQVSRNSDWHVIYTRSCDQALRIEGLSTDQNAILMIDPDSNGRASLWSQPLDGSARSVVLEDPAGNVTRVAYDWIRGVPTEAWIDGAVSRHVWLDKDAEQRSRILESSFPGRLVRIETESSDKKVVVARISGPSSPGVHYLIDLATHHADIVGADYPALANVKLGGVTTLHYEARDGTDIEAYLTLPPDAGDAALPLVVLPHGGPARHDFADDFEEMRQFVASRGYAVFQPQFRGSSGFGEAFERAGYHQWGLLMQDDLTDGVKALIDKGHVDPQRICIVGDSYAWGYAGYAALAGAAYTPTLYKCAVSVNGVSDLPKFLGYLVDKYGIGHPMVAFAREHIGDGFDDTVVAKSPARSADSVTADVLLIDSANDADVPPSQSKLMADALRSAGKNVREVELPGADHSMSDSATRSRSLEEIDKFLHDHL